MNHVVSALHAFLSRYAAVFRAAWKERHKLEAPPRSQHEIDFLPAHLELVETPVSPASRWIIRTIIALFCVALLWAWFGKVDIVAVAPGQIVVSSRTKVIQSAETAVVRRILVRDGQAVDKGQLLIELDSTATGAEYAQADEALTDARIARLRLSALAEALASGKPPTLEADPALPPERIREAERLTRSEFAAYEARRASLGAAVAQRQAEIRTVKGLIGPLSEAARIATTRAKDLADLVGGQYVSRHDYLQRERERIAAERDLAAQRNRLVEARAALKVAREELRILIADTRQQTLDGLRQAQEQMRQYAPTVASTGRRNQLMELRAPVAGTVQQLAVHTVGGVVTSAQPLLMVVPSEEPLEVEATVLNKDIGFVKVGQSVTVKLESFPYTRYGYLTGIVDTVSHDAIQDERMGLVFSTRVKLKQTSLMIDGIDVGLTPGMALNVEIKTGKRKLISYLLSPLRQHTSESMRER